MSTPSTTTPSTTVSIEEFQAVFDRVSRWGRYDAPQRGAWNLAGVEAARRGAAAVRSGVVVGMALPWNTVAGIDNPKPALHHMTDLGDVEPAEPSCHKDFIGIDYHGKASSHLDALAHIAWRGELFDGRAAREVVDAGGARYGTVEALGPLVTRGVLLDLPAVRGVAWLEPGEPLYPADLAAAEDHAGVPIAPGDAVLVRSGQFARRQALGAWDSGAASAGLHVSAAPWLFERDVAVLGADGDSDVRPSPVPGVHSPIHVLALTAMGVPLLDNLDLEALSAACQEAGRYAFQLILAPLRIGLGELDRAGVAWRYLDEDVDVLRTSDIGGLDAVLFARPAVAASTFAGPGPFPRLFARFGVGYDTVDLAACTANRAMVTITPDGARRAVATATLTLVLAARQHLVVKDRLVRTATWSDRTRWMGRGLTGRTVGFVGLGNTGSDLVTLLAPFGCRILASDPALTDAGARALGAELCSVETVFEASDVVVVMAVLNPGTHHLVGRRLLALMSPDALLVNVGRGPIVHQADLVDALRAGRPGAAALDVFEDEPLDPGSPLIGMDNVVLTPHSLAWTDEMAIGNGSSAVRAILDVRDGRVPRYVVNRDVLDRGAGLTSGPGQPG